MYKKSIEIGLNELDNLINKFGVPGVVELHDTDANREFVDVASKIDKYKNIEFKIVDTDGTKSASSLRELGELLDCNIDIGF